MSLFTSISSLVQVVDVGGTSEKGRFCTSFTVFKRDPLTKALVDGRADETDFLGSGLFVIG